MHKTLNVGCVFVGTLDEKKEEREESERHKERGSPEIRRPRERLLDVQETKRGPTVEREAAILGNATLLQSHSWKLSLNSTSCFLFLCNQ